MNTDDFEKQLQRQTLLPPPAAWREEILAAAHANTRRAEPAGETGLLAGWRAFRARIPVAWGAVAVLWVVIIGANSLLSGPSITFSASAPAPRATMTAWSAQRIQASLLVNGPADFPEIAPQRETSTAPPRPRSDRRRDNGLGGVDHRQPFITVAWTRMNQPPRNADADESNSREFAKFASASSASIHG